MHAYLRNFYEVDTYVSTVDLYREKNGVSFKFSEKGKSGNRWWAYQNTLARIGKGMDKFLFLPVVSFGTIVSGSEIPTAITWHFERAIKSVLSLLFMTIILIFALSFTKRWVKYSNKVNVEGYLEKKN